MIGISNTSGTVIHMFSYRRAEEYSFFLFCSPVQFVIAGACVLFPQKKKNSEKEEKKRTQNIKKNLCYFS